MHVTNIESTHLPKQAVRDWLHREVAEKRPPPTPEQIRRELGWGLLKRK